MIFVNGCFIGRNDNGYAPFRFDLTDFLAVGAKNYIVARVDASFGDGWFYEGAGIYRHVWLTKTDRAAPGQVGEHGAHRRSARASATLTLGTVVENEGKQAENAKVSWQILDAAGKTVATAEAPAQSVAVGRRSQLHCDRQACQSALWSVDAPNLYSAIVTVESDGKARDAERVSFGVRTAVFDADKGFFLNGKSIKIQGHLQPPGSRRRRRGAARPPAVVPLGVLRRWAATRCAPRTICPRRSGSKPATAWA